MTKTEITRFLRDAGFDESGANQFVHKEHGRIHLYEWTVAETVQKLMSLGATHRTHEIKQLLEVKEEFSFQPTA